MIMIYRRVERRTPVSAASSVLLIFCTNEEGRAECLKSIIIYRRGFIQAFTAPDRGARLPRGAISGGHHARPSASCPAPGRAARLSEISCKNCVNCSSKVITEGMAPVIDKLTGYQVNIGACTENPAGLAVADILTVYPCAGNVSGVVVVALKAERLCVEIQALMRAAEPDFAVVLEIPQSLSALYFGTRQNLQSLLEGGFGLSLDNRPNLFKGGGKSSMIIRACAEDLFCEDVSAAEKVSVVDFHFVSPVVLISVSIIKHCFVECNCFYKLFYALLIKCYAHHIYKTS